MNTPKIISRKKVEHLLYHVVDGFACSQKGIIKLYNDGIITAKEYNDLMAKNLTRLQERIHEFRVVEKMLSLLFACLFTFMAFTSNDGDLYRRGRSGRRARRRDEYVISNDLEKED